MVTAASGPGRFGIAFERLGVERAWTRTRGSPEVVVAVVDQGVQLDHPLLGPNLQRDFTHPAFTSDHREIPGTHSAGIIAGRRSETEQFSGVAPAARVLPVRYSQVPGSQALDLPHAIEYAVERGACVVQLAHDADLSSSAAQRAVQYAATRNVLVVGTAGVAAENLGDDEMPNLLRILPVNERGEPVLAVDPAAAHLAAPGFAHVPRWRGEGHDVHAGPSLAAPFVSGCAALLRALNPGWGYHELKDHLLASGTVHESLAAHCRTGAMLQVARAVLGPLELLNPQSPASGCASGTLELRWALHYQPALCTQAIALYRARGKDHWRELASAQIGARRLVLPAGTLPAGSGTLRLACRGSNFHADDVEIGGS